MGTFKIFCDCGREIWTEMADHLMKTVTLADVKKRAECSDCMLARMRELGREESVCDT